MRFARKSRAQRAGTAGRLLLAAACCLAVFPVQAQTVGTVPENMTEDLKARRESLGQTRESQQRLRKEIELLAKERSRLSSELVTTADRAREAETRLSASERRLEELTESEADVRKKFEGSRAVMAELLAALQRMGRHPPPALLVQPEDALEAIRSALLFGTMLPELRGKAQELAADLEELSRVRREAAVERNRVAAEQADLRAAQARLSLLVEVRQRRQEEREETLKGEVARADELSREVKSLEELIARMERDVEATRKAAELAAKAEQEAAKPGSRNALAALSDPGRLSPAVSFGSAKGMLPLPVSGTLLRGFGESDDTGAAQKGLTISTRSQAQVTAPSDGWVVYSGPFRSYGQLLILNAGGGYHVLLAGMETINVSLGQFVLTGEPVAQMGAASSQIASIVGGGARQPVLYVEFRKDGQSIDPAPWWASSSEKVRG